MEITKERAKEILNQYKKDSALFNWCEEYKQFVKDNVYFNDTMMVEYILKASWEDSETPFNFDDIENLYYTEEEIKEEEKHYLKTLSEEEKQDFINRRLEESKEVLCWVSISDYLRVEFEEQKEVLLNNYWGRRTFGQAYNMDSCLIHAFLNKISRNL